MTKEQDQSGAPDAPEDEKKSVGEAQGLEEKEGDKPEDTDAEESDDESEEEGEDGAE